MPPQAEIWISSSLALLARAAAQAAAPSLLQIFFPLRAQASAPVGAGQAGLAIGHLLARQGRPFVILEAGDAVGSAWRARWDSLTLFTPRRYDGLPGLAFPGDPDGYPTRAAVVAYLERYAAPFGLPVEPAGPPP